MNVDGLLQCKSPKWRIKATKKIAEKHKPNRITASHIIRGAIDFFIVEYKGSFDITSLDDLAFEARKKIEDQQ